MIYPKPNDIPEDPPLAGIQPQIHHGSANAGDASSVTQSRNLSLGLDILIENPNKVSIKYQTSSASLRYRSERRLHSRAIKKLKYSSECPSSGVFHMVVGNFGCANIARKVSRAMIMSPNTTISAIGSRSLEKATAFASANHFPESTKVYGRYDAVLDDPDVDAVYVPLPTSLHVRWAVLAAEKKKHVLLEKPVALNVGELDTILAACESSGVQFMDATMWMHHPRTAKMKQADPGEDMSWKGDWVDIVDNVAFGNSAGEIGGPVGDAVD
ncbi:hypothetical protein L1987_13660 [Smallanthus sonchifolius]|uniref:Uncharacterized protein n=1 Tax=Smallanthus sonchifolius TaxID=185202 RepID=A0ACB9JIN6_9ASTR|nr:hypothetical protein L1987_13660 [Smallanthus sonchifolius]